MSEDAPAVTTVACIAVDAADPAAIGRWWGRLLGLPVLIDDDGDARVELPNGPAIDFLRVPEAKTIKNRLHLDLGTLDVAAATEQALALGATRADDVYAGGSWQVLRDPEGNEFCLLSPSDG